MHGRLPPRLPLPRRVPRAPGRPGRPDCRPRTSPSNESGGPIRRCRRPGRAGRRRCRRGPGSRAPLVGLAVGPAARHGRRPTHRHRPRRPTAVVPPSHAADCASAALREVPRVAVPRDRRLPRRRRRLRSSRPRRQRRHHRPGPRQRRLHPRRPQRPPRGRPRAAPIPGRSDRPGTRRTGSTPPGGPAHAGPARPRRSSDGDGPDDQHAHLDHPRRRRTGRPVSRPRRACLGPSSRR